MYIFVFTNAFVSTTLAPFGQPTGSMYNFNNFSGYLNKLQEYASNGLDPFR
ncbi:hypothetical protein SAMN05421820_105140 [Pedobacter steynii]|uniref:Uncharacterized protein n=1 Tax=Pedobacter steynii TaxID=430522 RepID=A0A1G9WDG8_9SPHI|nr:hypothetical protein [Pedobacter steynii]NQX40263.1 hypothetical protein [Pedobacter steynii]SDM82558.1 hypothetical protein SAMN05421820_105140 [Pedobacter steynii]